MFVWRWVFVWQVSVCLVSECLSGGSVFVWRWVFILQVSVCLASECLSGRVSVCLVGQCLSGRLVFVWRVNVFILVGQCLSSGRVWFRKLLFFPEAGMCGWTLRAALHRECCTDTLWHWKWFLLYSYMKMDKSLGLIFLWICVGFVCYGTHAAFMEKLADFKICADRDCSCELH